MATQTTQTGIHQGDLILLSALSEGFKDMRKNSWVLDSAFMSLLQDSVTVKDHGMKAVRDARDWFLKNEVNFYHGLGGVRPELPCVEILLQSSEETEATTGDKHFLVDEPLGEKGGIITDPFAAESYDPLSGVLVLPASVRDRVWLSTNMEVLEGNGVAHRVTEVREDDSLVIAGPAGDFRRAQLRYLFPRRVQLESVHEREVYQLGIHTQGPPIRTLVLHALVKFCLWRYKQSLLEARNFSGMTLSSSDFSRNGSIPPEENCFSRYVTVAGTVRQTWPKDVVQPPAMVGMGLQVIGGATVPPEFGDPDTLLWSGDEDVLDGVKTGG